MPTFYGFDNPIFKKERRYRRLAREHMAVSQLKSDRIKWRIVETATALQIPVKYEIDYLIKSIVGIHADQSPIYGDKHTVEISFPAKFPLETFKAKALTDIWHPNIKWDGPTKGRICVNNQNFGRGYDIFLLILRLGEIIQYKNYLAENIPPYPEDAKVAQWVLNYAEPNNIVSIKDKKAVDDSNLLEYSQPQPSVEKKKIVIKGIQHSNIKITKIKKKN